MMVSSVIRHLDFWTSVPFHSWWGHPITAVFTVKGCARGCITCGASRPAFRRFMPGCFPLIRSPEAIAGQVRQLAEITRAPIFFVGDLRDGGATYARDVLAALARAPVPNRLVFEFFDPPGAALIEAIDASVPHWGAELSPESHDESIRARLGKAHFTNARMEDAIGAILRSRCEALDLFFMIGLPGQTHANVMDMVDAIEQLFVRSDRRLSAFITPMGPFLDPGSNGFEHAEARGYRLYAHTLAEHRALLEENDWESILNYETRWMTRAEIVDATYDAAERLNELKLRHGRINAKTAAGVRDRLARARAIRARLAHGSVDATLSREVRDASQGTVNDKAELFAPSAFLTSFRIGGILRLLVREWTRTAVGDGAHAFRSIGGDTFVAKEKP
jgi:radical SAM superfamily enzyme YgiQ (UPF0313 family)